MKTKPPTLYEIRRLAIQFASSRNAEELPSKALPVAFPISFVTCKTRERKSEKKGFVERNILRVLCKLGVSSTCSAAAINEILHVGEDRIDAYLRQLEKYNKWLIRKKNGFMVEPGTTEDITDKAFTEERTHNRKFVVNGQTGELLPIRLGEDLDRWFVQPSEKGFKQEWLKFLRTFLIPHKANASDVQKNIEDWISSRDAEARAKVGIPEGALSVESESIKENNFWTLSILLLDKDGSIEIRPFLKDEIEFALPGEGASNKAYLDALARTSSEKFGVPFSKLDRNEMDLPSGVSMEEKRGNQCFLSVDEPNGLLTQKSSLPSWLITGLSAALHWNDLGTWPNWDIYRFEPGNKKTAECVGILRGLHKLRGVFRDQGIADLRKEKFSIGDWWIKFQNEFTSNLPRKIHPKKITLERFRSETSQFPDTEFVQKVEELIRTTNSGKEGLIKRILKPISRKQTPLTGPVDRMSLIENDPEKRKSQAGKALLQAIGKAKESIRVISWLIRDEKIVRALVKARSRKVTVEVITELTERESKDKFATIGFDMEKSSTGKSLDSLGKLSRGGVWCRSLPFVAHLKMLIVDGQTAFISSINLDSTSLGWGENKSHEAGLRITQAKTVAVLEQAFKDLWQACIGEQHQKRMERSVSSRTPKSVPAKNLFRDLGDGLKLAFSIPPRRFRLRDHLIEMIDEAKNEIILACLLFYDSEKIKGFHESLVNALQRKVRITVLVRTAQALEFNRQGKYPDPGTEKLINKGLVIKGIADLHAKGILIDGEKWGLTSANFNPFSLHSSAKSAHVEIGLFGLRSKEPEYADFLRELAKKGKKIDFKQTS